MTFTTQCFSGECEFCKGCWDRKSIIHEPSQRTEFLDRASDFKKFFSSDEITKELDLYNKTLKSIIQRSDYISPSDPGLISKHKRMNGIDYTLIEDVLGSHSAICDSLICKIFYLNSHDSVKTMYFSKLPVYTRTSDDKMQFCAVCIERSSR